MIENEGVIAGGLMIALVVIVVVVSAIFQEIAADESCIDLGYTTAVRGGSVEYCVSYGLEPRIMRLDAQED